MSKTAHCAAPAGTLDWSVLREFVGDDPATLARFVALGLQSLEQAMQPLLGTAAQAPTLALLREAGHRAKSTARQLGIVDWAQDCEALECAARDGQNALAAALHERVLQAWPIVRARLYSGIRELQARADSKA